MYAEKTGVGSVLSPLEMMMPMGSDDPFSLRSFFILTLVGECHNMFEPLIGTRYAMLDVVYKSLLIKDLRVRTWDCRGASVAK